MTGNDDGHCNPTTRIASHTTRVTGGLALHYGTTPDSRTTRRRESVQCEEHGSRRTADNDTEANDIILSKRLFNNSKTTKSQRRGNLHIMTINKNIIYKNK